MRPSDFIGPTLVTLFLAIVLVTLLYSGPIGYIILGIMAIVSVLIWYTFIH